MASAGVAPASGIRDVKANTAGVEKLPDEMNDMKIKDDKVKANLSFVFFFLHLYLLCIQSIYVKICCTKYRKWKQLW